MGYGMVVWMNYYLVYIQTFLYVYVRGMCTPRVLAYIF